MIRFKVCIAISCLVAILTGCDSNVLDSSEELSLQSSQQQNEVYDKTSIENLQDIPQFELELSAKLESWFTEVAVLKDSISAHDGIAIIGFKAPDSERLRESGGIRAALTAEEFKSALETVKSMDIDLEFKSIYSSFGAAAVRLNPEDLDKLFDHPNIDYIEKPVIYNLDSIESPGQSNDHKVQAQTTPWGIDLIRAPTAWSEGTGNGAKVLVIDSGMNNHEDLPNRPTSNCGPGGCQDDHTNHGTHVSGTLMAVDNAYGVVGVAPGINNNDVYSYGACFDSQCGLNAIIDGIQYGITNDVDVINMSFSTSNSNIGMENAVQAAWNAGIVLVASAGNVPVVSPGTTVYPAGYNNVIGVSGVDEYGFFAGSSPCPRYSNHGSHVSISAPFWALSTVGTNSYQDETYGWCGTSMAAPHVAGAAAVLIDQNPSWNNFQIRQRLQNTAFHPTGESSPDQQYGHGVLDVAAAVGIAVPLQVSVSGPTFIQVGETVTFESSVTGGIRPYEYQWQIDYNMGTGPWQDVGGGANFFPHTPFDDRDFAVRVVVTDADNNSQPSFHHHVTVSW